MLDIRLCRSQDIDAARRLLPPGATEPDWGTTVVVERDGVILAVGALRSVYHFEPLGAASPFSAYLLMSWMDGNLASRTPSYFAAVDDTNERFKHALSNLPLKQVRSLTFYRRDF